MEFYNTIKELYPLGCDEDFGQLEGCDNFVDEDND